MMAAVSIRGYTEALHSSRVQRRQDPAFTLNQPVCSRIQRRFSSARETVTELPQWAFLNRAVAVFVRQRCSHIDVRWNISNEVVFTLFGTDP
jgi:hypothetical protein